MSLILYNQFYIRVAYSVHTCTRLKHEHLQTAHASHTNYIHTY